MPGEPQPPGALPPDLERILLKALLEHLPDNIYFKDRACRFLAVNEAMARWVGVARETLLGRSDFDLFDATHAAPAFADEQRIMASGQALLDHEEKEVWPDGRVTWVASTKVPLRDLAGQVIGTFGISRDITARHATEEHLRTLTRALDQCPVSIIITDTSGCIRFANPAFARTSGYTLREVVGSTPRLLRSGHHDTAFYTELWATIGAGQNWTGELCNRRKDGSLYWEHSTIAPVFDETGAIVNYIAFNEDITERRRIEEENRALAAQLNLAQKLESVGRLSAGIAHEINTPSQFVSDNLRFLAESLAQLEPYFAAVAALQAAATSLPQLEPALAALAAAERSADLAFLREELPRSIEQSLEGMTRIARIVGALKDFAHPASTGRVPTDLAQLLETTLTVSRHEWKYAAEVATELDPTLPPVPVVQDEINQALLNLVINAAQAVAAANTEQQRIKGRIVLRTLQEGPFAIVEVEDDGCGVADTVRPHLFEPFITTKRADKAPGQGLHVVQAIARRHGGRAEYTPAAQRGSIFRLILPLQPPPAG